MRRSPAHGQTRPCGCTATASNLLVVDGRLRAVIDFGCTAVGDPARDLVIAWTFFEDESREVFRRSLPFDDATWARSRGWALWKSLVTLVEDRRAQAGAAHRFGWRSSSRAIVDAVVAEHYSSR
jgi:aminoglycoside phosphotransferase (APT) family kinase protein